jgi:hypothetical protein
MRGAFLHLRLSKQLYHDERAQDLRRSIKSCPVAQNAAGLFFHRGSTPTAQPPPSMSATAIMLSKTAIITTASRVLSLLAKPATAFRTIRLTAGLTTICGRAIFCFASPRKKSVTPPSDHAPPDDNSTCWTLSTSQNLHKQDSEDGYDLSVQTALIGMQQIPLCQPQRPGMVSFPHVQFLRRARSRPPQCWSRLRPSTGQRCGCQPCAFMQELKNVCFLMSPSEPAPKYALCGVSLSQLSRSVVKSC